MIDPIIQRAMGRHLGQNRFDLKNFVLLSLTISCVAGGILILFNFIGDPFESRITRIQYFSIACALLVPIAASLIYLMTKNIQEI